LTGIRWTSSEKNLLRDLYNEGRSVDYIAHELKKSVSAVEVQAFRIGLSRRPSTKEPGPNTSYKLSQRHLTAVDLASRIASLLGLAPMIEVEARTFTDDELMQFTRQDDLIGIISFLRDLLDVQLQDYQLEIVSKLLGAKNLVVVSGRQVGKDFTIASFSLWESIVRPNSKIVIVSAAQRQSDLLNDRILSFIAGNDQLYASVLKAGREELRFKNASAIYFLPATGLIRGYTEVTRCFVNEARDVPDTVYDAITPMLSRRNGHLSIFSTPLGRVGYLWEVWSSLLFEKVHVASRQNKYLDPAYLQAERDRMSSMSYSCEYEGEFQSSQQNYFDPISIEKAVEDYELSLIYDKSRGVKEQLRCSIGIDWGRTKDASVMTVLASAKTGEAAVIFIKSFEGVSFEDQIPCVKYLKDVFNPVRIVSEDAGLSIGVNDALVRMGIGIVRWLPTNASKITLFDNLRSKFDRREITIPADPPRLRRELLSLEYETLPSGSVRIGHASGGHDDFCVSLALALWPFRPVQNKPIRLIATPINTYRSMFPQGPRR
jgi:hypothetical protein